MVIVDLLRVEGLTTKFSIELDHQNMGKAKIDIYNLNSDHRAQLQDSKSVDVELLAGYKEGSLDRLFLGTLRDVFSEQSHPDWITTLRTGDGDKAGKARINRSYAPGTPKSIKWKDITDALKGAGIGVGNAIEAFEAGKFADGVTQLLHGGLSQGSSWEEIKRMAKSASLDVSILDNELVVVPIGEPLATRAIVLGPNSGLIGSPQVGPKRELRCRSLILPGLRPKRQVKIKSRLVDGVYVVRKAKYTGDTSSNDWYVDLTCKEL